MVNLRLASSLNRRAREGRKRDIEYEKHRWREERSCEALWWTSYMTRNGIGEAGGADLTETSASGIRTEAKPAIWKFELVMDVEGRVRGPHASERGGLEDRFSIAHKDEPLAALTTTGLVQLPVSRPFLAVLSWLPSVARYASAVGPSCSPALTHRTPVLLSTCGRRNSLGRSLLS